jgi:hypothetical protein
MGVTLNARWPGYFVDLNHAVMSFGTRFALSQTDDGGVSRIFTSQSDTCV